MSFGTMNSLDDPTSNVDRQRVYKIPIYIYNFPLFLSNGPKFMLLEINVNFVILNFRMNGLSSGGRMKTSNIQHNRTPIIRISDKSNK